MRRLILINPRAGRGAALRTWERLARRVGPDLEVAVPRDCQETRAMARLAVRAGYERVIGVGGDGTLNAVACELAGSNLILGAVPAGTGNDLCRNLGLPALPEEALAVALGESHRTIDLGVVGQERPFLNVASCGFDAEVAAAAGRMPAGLGGTMPYLLGALSTLRGFRPRMAEVLVDGQRIVQPCTLVAVANGPCYGGGMRIAPRACPDDGLLEVILAGSLSRWELVRLLARVYHGGHIDHPQVRLLRGERVEVRMEGCRRSQLDGEPLELERLEVRLWRRALRVAVPPALASPTPVSGRSGA
ncbi:MAG: diacylglycerol/lipid kinase family protein [Bacillota bacterium]